jgi:CBS domain-containing protein
MARRVREVMTLHPHALRADSTLQEAAKEMREADIGTVIVTKDGAICGIVTDRDIVVRGVALGKGPETPLGDVCTRFIVTLSPDTEIDEAIRLMRDRAVRRLPVEEDGEPVGIISLVDLALEQQDYSVLSQLNGALHTTR